MGNLQTLPVENLFPFVVKKSSLWVLLGTEHDTVENEPFVYFVGIYDDLTKAQEKLLELDSKIEPKFRKQCYEIKPVEMNKDYPYSFSYE